MSSKRRATICIRSNSTNHIFPEIQVYSARTPSQDELIKALEAQVWSHPVVKFGGKNYRIKGNLVVCTEYSWKWRLTTYYLRSSYFRWSIQQTELQSWVYTWVMYFRSGCFKTVNIWLGMSFVNMLLFTQ